MNKQQNKIKEIELLNTIKKSSLYATRDGCIKCWRGVTFDHFMTMAAVCWKIANQGYRIFTEVEFKNGGRADIVAIKGQHAYIIEILHTESEARFSSKKDLYPEDFFIIPINTKNFNINKFEL